MMGVHLGSLLVSALAAVGFAGVEADRGVIVVEPGDRVVRELGELSPGVSREFVVTVQSRFQHAWVLPEEDVSCPACVEVLAAPARLLPGRLADIRIRVTPTREAGPHRWGVVLHGGDVAPLRIDLHGVVTGLEVSPSMVALGKLKVGQSWQKVLQVKWHGPGRITSMVVESDVPELRAGPVAPSGAVWHCPIHVLAGRTGPVNGTLRMQVTLEDATKNVQTIEWSTPVRGVAIDPDVRARPASVFFGSLAKGDVSSVTLRVQGAPRSSPAIRTDLQGLQVGPYDSESGELALTLDAASLAAGVHQGTVSLVWLQENQATRVMVPIIAHIENRELK